MTYLVLGESDALSEAVAEALGAVGREVRALASPLLAPSRFSWRLDSATSHSELHLPDGTMLTEGDIEGVLVRPGAWLAQEGWAVGEHEYVQAEATAAMLGWLHSLPCIVINRYSADLWYQPNPPLLRWWAALGAAGLARADAIITNDPATARAFAPSGALYTALTDSSSYRIADTAAWGELAKLQAHLPVALTSLQPVKHIACVVAGTVVWQNRPTQTVLLEAKLRRFAAEVGLTCLTVAFAAPADQPVVAAVTTHAQYATFDAAAQAQIVAALVKVMMNGDLFYARVKGET